MKQLYYDTMTIICFCIKLNLFITMTCNSRWNEIIFNLESK